jgi:hypothetical protein
MDGSGKVFYYSEYNLSGSFKRNINAAWPCCSGTRPQAVSDYHDIIYYKDADNLYVNLFTASKVDWDRKGGRISISQNTSFPESAKTSFTVETAQPSEFGIKVRVPGWLAGPMKARVNGEAVAVETDSNHWASFHRTWKSGDTLELTLPMKLWVSRIDPQKEYPAAIMYGPVALAVRSLGTNPASQIDLANIEKSLIPSPAEPLTWHSASDPSVLVRPFYVFKEGETYFLYLDPSKDPAKKPYKAARYSDGWMDFGGWMTTATPTSSAEYTFEGKALRVHYFKYDDAGRFEVAIDGKVVGTIDEYGPERGEPAFEDFKDLGEGKHTIRFTLLPDKSPESKGIYSNLAAFELLIGG